MKFDHVYFFNGTAYAGKSTMVKRLAEKYDGIACEENYHEALMDNLDWNEFPNLGYTANLKDWAEFIRRTPDEYASWIEGGSQRGRNIGTTNIGGFSENYGQKNICRY